MQPKHPWLAIRGDQEQEGYLMQSIISAEDDLVKALRSTLSLCDPSEHHDLQHYISPSIEEQLSGRYNPLPIACAHDEENPALSTLTPLLPKCLHMLPSLELQKKEKWHQSYGIHWAACRHEGLRVCRHVFYYARTVLDTLQKIHCYFPKKLTALTLTNLLALMKAPR